jgi:hypothetical protein
MIAACISPRGDRPIGAMPTWNMPAREDATMNAARRGLFVAAIGMVLGAAGPALAGGGNVLPSEARAKGYSLAELARITGPYVTGSYSESPDTPPPPDIPFHIVLPGDATVRPGTMLYLPVNFIDDAGFTFPGFPATVGDQAADAAFLASADFISFNVTQNFVEVDGQITTLDNGYVSGVVSSPLLDGTPTGSRYIVQAVFLTPLTPGQHTVRVGGFIDGKPVVLNSFALKVR